MGTPGRPRCPATMIRRKHHDPYSQEEAADLEALALGDSGTGAALEANEGKAWVMRPPIVADCNTVGILSTEELEAWVNSLSSLEELTLSGQNLAHLIPSHGPFIPWDLFQDPQAQAARKIRVGDLLPPGDAGLRSKRWHSTAQLSTPMMLEVEPKFCCKYGPADYNEQEMTALAELENAKSAEAVEAAFQNIGALDEDGFHPRIVRALYDKIHGLARGGRADGPREANALTKMAARLAVAGQEGGVVGSRVAGMELKRDPQQKLCLRQTREEAQGAQDQLEDLFGEKAAARGVQHLLRSDIGVSETPPCFLANQKQLTCRYS
ncbi:unnamed protein product [Symbiodinium necroappetens]|uniref:Uncharacterized protein n=1 Tax=Symbiodinium necroappetens TaxID=1628268 RepID=A0A812LA43_9DINO|nr:unnamed protein product [Symbiodinium necroappetens]